MRPLISRTMISLKMSTTETEMDVGEFEQAVFKKTAVVKENVGKYTLEATIEKAALNSYLLEYKEEMKRRKVLFPGFRAGKLPPYVMPDVRKYLVCYGLETLIGQLCNGNGLKVSLTLHFNITRWLSPGTQFDLTFFIWYCTTDVLRNRSSGTFR